MCINYISTSTGTKTGILSLPLPFSFLPSLSHSQPLRCSRPLQMPSTVLRPQA